MYLRAISVGESALEYQYNIMKKKKKIYLVSSGTGGHAAPILLLYKKLSALSGVEALILHSGSEIEQKLFKNTKSKKIISARFDRNSMAKKLVSYPLVFAGMIQSKIFFIFKRPDLIISKGGYGSVPVLFVARFLKIPYFLHESDSHMGLANKLFAKKAEKIFLGFPKKLYDEDVDDKKYIYVGQLVSDLPKIKKEKRKVIYITGGSQGAESVNKEVYKVVDKLIESYQIYHQVGDNNIEVAKKIKSSLKNNSENYAPFGFSYDLAKEAMAKADLVVARAGANTIGEIAKNKKASILIPYPYASENHQMKNAKYLERTGSAILVPQRQLNEKYLLERVDYLLKGNNAEVLGEKANKAIKSGAIEEIVDAALKEVKG